MKQKIYDLKLTKEQMKLLNNSLNTLITTGQEIIKDNYFKNLFEKLAFVETQEKLINLGTNILKQKLEQDGFKICKN